jgi:hypothetical protein
MYPGKRIQPLERRLDARIVHHINTVVKDLNTQEQAMLVLRQQLEENRAKKMESSLCNSDRWNVRLAIGTVDRMFTPKLKQR